MPMIIVEGPRLLDLEQKRQLVKKLTEAAVAVYGIKQISVIIHENPPENVGAEGELIADRIKK